ncbi:MAG: helix-turn-helix domain-containing protein [Pseudomonadota bacterium]|nr:helix-turn-helix domain-containing protein [Pseudomonadota bacterium]
MSHHKALLEKAVKIVGSQQKLADAIGKSQQGISYLLNSAPMVSAEDAIAIEKATGGGITREQLRPDVFGSRSSAA